VTLIRGAVASSTPVNTSDTRQTLTHLLVHLARLFSGNGQGRKGLTASIEPRVPMCGVLMEAQRHSCGATLLFTPLPRRHATPHANKVPLPQP
jgi:hypothetical protein